MRGSPAPLTFKFRLTAHCLSRFAGGTSLDPHTSDPLLLIAADHHHHNQQPRFIILAAHRILITHFSTIPESYIIMGKQIDLNELKNHKSGMLLHGRASEGEQLEHCDCAERKLTTAHALSVVSSYVDLDDTPRSLSCLFDTEDSAWTVVEGKVYDVTKFLDDVSIPFYSVAPAATDTMHTDTDISRHLLSSSHPTHASTAALQSCSTNSTQAERRSSSRIAARTPPRLSGPTTARRSSRRLPQSTTLASSRTLLSSELQQPSL